MDLDFIDKNNAKFFNSSAIGVKNRVGVGEIKALCQAKKYSQKEENGQLVIVGGSTLFHGAPLLSLSVASRIVDMVFFSCPKDNKDFVRELNSRLYSFIWIPEDDLEYYLQKADAVLIGPGMMRCDNEKTKENEVDGEGARTKKITERLLKKFPQKKWIIDAGSLQTIDARFLPKGAVVTPNSKEFKMLFGVEKTQENIGKMAQKYQIIIVDKSAEAGVYDGLGGMGYRYIGLPQPGLTKGGTGDVTAGVIAAFACKNDPFLAACAGTFIVKFAARQLAEKTGNYYNADDLAKKIPESLKWCLDF